MARRVLQFAVWTCALAAASCGGWWGYREWQAGASRPTVAASEAPKPSADGAVPVRLSPQARKNLGLVAQRLSVTTYWRTIDLPGVIVDRPGISDRGVVTPVSGVVTRIHKFPGDTVEPDAALFSVRLVSEALHTAQLELFKATKEIELAQQQLQRLSDVAQAGGLPQSRIIDIESQIQRQRVIVQAYRQNLQSHGLPTDVIETATKGEFVTELVVRAPGQQAIDVAQASVPRTEDRAAGARFSYELQTLNVELGQQVQAGHLLCYLADHRALLIEGRGFKDDMPLIQEAARTGSTVEVDYENSAVGNWPPVPSKLQIHHVANSVDPETRTFAFYLAIENQWQPYARDGLTRLLWRFRPGSRVRLRVAVQKFENVIVVPQAAVVREGPEAYVFRQNGDLFDRRPVHVLQEDRVSVVLANDGSVRPGTFIAQNGAASLNRVLKAQLASGQPTNLHVHADGTTHAAH